MKSLKLEELKTNLLKIEKYISSVIYVRSTIKRIHDSYTKSKYTKMARKILRPNVENDLESLNIAYKDVTKEVEENFPKVDEILSFDLKMKIYKKMRKDWEQNSKIADDPCVLIQKVVDETIHFLKYRYKPLAYYYAIKCMIEETKRIAKAYDMKNFVEVLDQRYNIIELHRFEYLRSNVKIDDNYLELLEEFLVHAFDDYRQVVRYTKNFLVRIDKPFLTHTKPVRDLTKDDYLTS